MPTGPRSVSRKESTRRRYSTNSLEGQRGTLQTSRRTGTLHGDMGIRDRIHHFTLAWFACTMVTTIKTSCGGRALC